MSTSLPAVIDPELQAMLGNIQDSAVVESSSGLRFPELKVASYDATKKITGLKEGDPYLHLYVNKDCIINEPINPRFFIMHNKSFFKETEKATNDNGREYYQETILSNLFSMWTQDIVLIKDVKSNQIIDEFTGVKALDRKIKKPYGNIRNYIIIGIDTKDFPEDVKEHLDILPGGFVIGFIDCTFMSMAGPDSSIKDPAPGSLQAEALKFIQIKKDPNTGENIPDYSLLRTKLFTCVGKTSPRDHYTFELLGDLEAQDVEGLKSIILNVEGTEEVPGALHKMTINNVQGADNFTEVAHNGLNNDRKPTPVKPQPATPEPTPEPTGPTINYDGGKDAEFKDEPKPEVINTPNVESDIEDAFQ